MSTCFTDPGPSHRCFVVSAQFAAAFGAVFRFRNPSKRTLIFQLGWALSLSTLFVSQFPARYVVCSRRWPNLCRFFMIIIFILSFFCKFVSANKTVLRVLLSETKAETIFNGFFIGVRCSNLVD